MGNASRICASITTRLSTICLIAHSDGRPDPRALFSNTPLASNSF